MPARHRRFLVLLWLVIVSSALYLFAFHRVGVQAALRGAVSVSAVAGALVYLALGSLRGFTLVPATSLVLLGIAFFPPVPLFVLTLVGILVSSASIYLFAESLHVDDVLRRGHRDRVERLRARLQRHELPIIVGWSFFPFAPTDLICYLCGALRVGFVKCLAGVALGEGAICAIYIFLGDRLLQWLSLK